MFFALIGCKNPRKQEKVDAAAIYKAALAAFNITEEPVSK